MRRPSRCSILSLLLSVILAGTDASGQFTSGIQGTVTDPLGAVVPNARVTIQNTATGNKQTILTRGSGNFRFNALPPAEYNLQVTSPGFSTAVQDGVRVRVGQIRTVNIGLTLGVETTEVSVTVTSPLMETGQARVSTLITDERLHALPLGERNFYELVFLAPGVTGLPEREGDIFNTNYGVDLYAGGHRAESNNFLVDSASVTSNVRGGQVNLSPNVDSVQEVRVSVSDYSAENGRNAAATVNVVTKRGTNQWHGTASWFHGQDALSARTLFQPEVPEFSKNQVGFSLGGPLRPDSTFLFASAEMLRSGSGTGSAAVVATPEFIDFMARNRPENVSTFLWNTFPADVAPVRNFVEAGPMARVDCGGLDAPSDEVASPIGSIPCNLPVTGEGDFAATLPRNGLQWNLRLDHLFGGGRDRLYANVYRTSLEQGGAFVYPGFNVVNPSHSLYVNLNETHTFSSATISETAFSFVRNWARGEVAHGEVPLIFPIGLSPFGTGIGPILTARNNFEIRQSLAFTHGAHNVKLGGIMHRGQSNGDFTGLSSRPGYIFLNVLEFADDNPFLHVNISFDPVTGGPKGLVQAVRTRTVGLFVQDDWKVTPNLTLNAGLRWETFGNPTDANGRMTNLVLGSGTTLAAQIAGASVDVVESLYRKADTNNWAPRLGLAWDPGGEGKWSIRAGFGLFYDRPSDQLYLNASLNTPIIARAQASRLTPPVLPVFALGATDEPPYGFPIPPGIEPGLDERNGLASGGRVHLLTSDPDLRTQYAENWFLGLQYSPVIDWVFEADYIGSAGHQLYGQTDVNRFAGDLVENNGVLTRLNESFGVIEYGQSNLDSRYHGGTVSVRRRSAAGLNFDLGYTFSKAIDQASTFHPMGGSQLPVAELTDLERQRGPADFDARHKLALSWSWPLPSPDSPFAVVAGILGGWELAGITLLQSGTPFSVVCSRPFVPVRDTEGAIAGNRGCDYNADGFNYDFPDTPAFGNTKRGLSRSDYINGVMSPADFPAPPLGRQGDLGRNTFRGPGYAGTDIALSRRFALTPLVGGVEGANLQFRAEVFNLFNRVNLGPVVGDLANPQFGRSRSTLPARGVQFALRLEF